MSSISVSDFGVKSHGQHLWANRVTILSDMDEEIQTLEQRLGKTDKECEITCCYALRMTVPRC